MGEQTLSSMGEKEQAGIWENILSASIKVILVFLVTQLNVDIEKYPLIEAQIEFAVAIITVGLLYGVTEVFRRRRRNRDYGKYVGRWFQMIPAMVDRPYTILEFRFNTEEKKYEVSGKNYYKSVGTDYVKFTAYRLVERRRKNGFYYITSTEPDNRNGLGKLCFDCEESVGLTRATGYFYDVTNDPSATRYETRMVKCDEGLWQEIRGNVPNHYKNIDDVPPEEIVKAYKEKADKQIEEYRVNHGII